MKRRKNLAVNWWLSMVVVSFLLSGCAASTSGPYQAAAPSNMENLLVQAGFKTFPQDSPKCQQVCAKLPPEQLTPQKKGDKIAYAYYSPASQRLYIGDELAYQTFINLAVAQSVEPRRRAVYETVPNDPEFWSLWENSQGGG